MTVSKNFLIALMGLSLALLAGSGIAQAQAGGDVSFGIRPTRAFEDRPESFSYFSYSLEPGAVLSDAALVMNSGDVPVTPTSVTFERASIADSTLAALAS